MRRIFTSDETLKIPAAARRAPLLFREKVALAAGIAAFGADAVELPAIKNRKEDAIIYKTIASLLKDAVLCLPVGFSEEGAAEAMQCIGGAAHPRLQVEFPLSAVQLEYSLGLKEEAALDKLAALLTAAKTACPDTELVIKDATGADRSFLLKACALAEAAGVTVLTLCDDAGLYSPAETAALVQDVVRAVSVPVCYAPNDSIGFGCANAFAALESGCTGVKTALSGETALHTDRFAAAFSMKGAQMNLACNLHLMEVKSGAESLLKSLIRTETEGKIAVPGSAEDIFLDAASTQGEVEAAAAGLGYTLSAEDVGKVTDALHTVCGKKSSVGAKELEAIIASAAMQVPSAYHLESYLISTGNLNASMASIRLRREEEVITGAAVGDGPIDSAFLAIEQCLGTHYELDEFRIEAVTEGKDSLGSALVCLRSGGKRFAGNGVSADIVGASIRAYINALNKIVYEEDRA